VVLPENVLSLISPSLKNLLLSEDDEYDDKEAEEPIDEVAQASSFVQDDVSPEQAQQLADLELANRIVRRYFYRMAYYKKKTNSN